MIDITEQFFVYTNSKPPKTDSISQKSVFLDTCTSLAFELTTISNRLKGLQTLIQKFGNLSKQQGTMNKTFMQLRQSFKEVDLRIKKLGLLEIDNKGGRSIRQKLKESMLIIMEMRFIELTIRYKKDYQLKVELQSKLNTKRQEKQSAPTKRELLEKPRFLQEEQQSLIQQTSRKQYEQIEKSIVQISQMYKHMASVVKLHSIMIDTIDDNTKDALGNVVEGRRNVSEIQKRQEANRKFILRVFLVIYGFVFIYIDFLL